MDIIIVFIIALVIGFGLGACYAYWRTLPRQVQPTGEPPEAEPILISGGTPDNNFDNCICRNWRFWR